MVLNIDNTEKKIFSLYKKDVKSDPSPLMLSFMEQDERLYFAFCITRNEFLYTNTAFKNFFESIITKLPTQFANYIDPADYKHLKVYAADIKSGIINNDIELNLKLPDKDVCRLKLSLMYHVNEEGESAISGYAEVIANKQESLAVAEDYQRKNKKLLNTLSHDLLSPMGSIYSLAGLLSRKSTLHQDPEINKWISLIEVISKKSINMIRVFVKKEFTEPEIFPVNKECL